MTRMKESGIDWIGQIPEEWESGKVKYFSKISAGATPDRNNLLFWNGDINWMSSGEVNQEIVKYTAETITNLALKKSSTKLLPIGTVMLAMNGQGKTKGTVAILAIETASNQSLASFIVDGNRLNNQYLYYFFKAGYSYIRGLKGEDRDGLNLQLVSNITVLLFDIKEQQKIADFLDKKTVQLDKAKALLEEQIQKLKDYGASLIYETVTKGLDKIVPMKDSGIDWIGQVPEGWEISKIRYLVTTRSEKRITNSSVPYIGLENIESQTGKFVETGIQVDKSENIVVEIGDVLFGKLRPYLRKYWRATFPSTASSEFLVFQSSELDMNFLYYAIQSDSFIEEVNTSTYGSKMPRASWEYIKNMKIAFPTSLVEQQKIADFLDKKTVQIDQLIQIKNKQIDNINKQRQTLIYDYVTGKRRV
ncbi:restriction endonuclease subunit S [Streptococcus cristatus]|uniref:EcoKI restriction-modification system protein HsdS n=1 Tax=Streptococcus cristatus TaxID=45634 RepID=A0A428H2G1_STRCR|nr:restriction endonuclease subunit S [Streptococcus cristatus]RSJ90057.1 EcoKI restriction-modification system protein HsdS [Streptococcus cristatus]